jgi:hypothetical protein
MAPHPKLKIKAAEIRVLEIWLESGFQASIPDVTGPFPGNPIP